MTPNAVIDALFDIWSDVKGANMADIEALIEEISSFPYASFSSA